MINNITMQINIDNYIIHALKEDITSEDITTNSIIKEKKVSNADLICKEDGVLAGLDIFIRVFQILDKEIKFESPFNDGDFLRKGTVVGQLTGDIRTILSGERTALNYLQRMCGIATYTRTFVNELSGYSTKLVDTRKTTPNMRPFEKYAVRVGGGHNHRYNLSDGVLIKDNHIKAAGSISKAVKMAQEYASFVCKIEVEVESLDMVKEALEAKADIIMFDNMNNETMKKAVKVIDGKAKTECSGNVTKDRLKEIAEIGVDYISCGALTYLAPVLDISIDLSDSLL